MSARVVGISLVLGLFGVPGIAAPVASQSPCDGQYCTLNGGDGLQRLNQAYFSDATSDTDRAQMRSIIAAKTSGGLTDWSTAAKEYFDWRASADGYSPPPAHPTGKPDPTSAQSAQEIAQKEQEQTVTREQKFRSAAEAAVRARLVDPDSAKFEWPFGFMYGYWKPVLSKRIEGYWTCGLVNARNRMGGYTGSSSFVAVVDEQGTPKYVEIGEDRDFDFTNMGCFKAAKVLPAPPAAIVHEAVDANIQESNASVADELEKLASLRDRGIITQQQFETQKSKVLGEQK